MSLRLLALLLLLALPAHAELSSVEWKRLTHQAASLAAKAGELDAKVGLIESVSKEDSGRVTALLVELAAASVKRREKLEPRHVKARADFVKQSRRLRKKHGLKSSRDVLENDPKWSSSREALDQVRGELDAAAGTLEAIGYAFGTFRSRDAIDVMVDASNRDLERARRSIDVRDGILRALLQQPVARATEPLLVFATDADMPEQRARVLQWIGKHKVKPGFDAAVASLSAPESAVSRSAVIALRALDDPRCVPALIGARRKATGLLADEIERALHRFTGESFFGVGADTMWAGWWRTHGQTWLSAERSKRYEPVSAANDGGAEFYGIRTRSNRIVFVLDRSDSMAQPVPQRGPTTGKTKETNVAGATRLEVAKNELARSIRSLHVDVKFAVVAYSHEVAVWRAAPGMAAANSRNKADAIDWFMEQRHVGSTMIFDALNEALKYARVGGGKSKTDPRGADTIFLLSDGAPTVRGGVALLRGAALEEAIQQFLEANRALRCVVHTIGVGPEHNRNLMQRLARETGGTYKAVEYGTK